MAGIEENLIKQCRRFGEPLPDRVKNKPVLRPGLGTYLEAFATLQHDRQWLVCPEKLIPCAIPWHVVNAYAGVYNITGAEYDDLLFFIKELDVVYVEYMTKR